MSDITHIGRQVVKGEGDQELQSVVLHVSVALAIKLDIRISPQLAIQKVWFLKV